MEKNFTFNFSGLFHSCWAHQQSIHVINELLVVNTQSISIVFSKWIDVREDFFL